MQVETESDRLARAIDEIAADVDHWDLGPKTKALALKRAVEKFHEVALRNLIKTLADDPGARQGLHRALADPLVYAMLRRHEIVKPSLDEQVLLALDVVRPELQQHGGDVELVNIAPPGEVTIRLTGACDGCGSSQITLEQGVMKTLREHCAWITDIHVDAKASANEVELEAQPIQIISPFEKGSHA